MEGLWSGKRVLVTGGGGFIGSAVVQALRRRGVEDRSIVVPRSTAYDLRSRANADAVVKDCEVVLHLAAPTGSVEFSRSHPASQYRDCTLINVNLFEAAREAGVAKLVSLGNLLAYPAACAVPFREEALNDGPVASGYMGIALAKRQLLDLAEMYRVEFGMNTINVLAANAYGPGDHFSGARAHVIPSTIAKCFRDQDLVVWGDGSATRDFLFVDDIAEGLLLAAEKLDAPAVVNLGSGREVSIAELVRTIARLTGFARDIRFDAARPGGDRRLASVERCERLLHFSPEVTLEDGLSRTIAWYRDSSSAPAS